MLPATIAELDLNPVIVGASGYAIVDARCRVALSKPRELEVRLLAFDPETPFRYQIPIAAAHEEFQLAGRRFQLISAKRNRFADQVDVEAAALRGGSAVPVPLYFLSDLQREPIAVVDAKR